MVCRRQRVKQLTATHKHIAALLNKLIEEYQIPDWLKAGVTFLIPKKKNEDAENPKNYRPVTGLPTMYILITSIISKRMQKYMDTEPDRARNTSPTQRKHNLNNTHAAT